MKNGSLTKKELKALRGIKKPGLQMDAIRDGQISHFVLSGTFEEFKLLREDLDLIMDREETEVKRHLSRNAGALFLAMVPEGKKKC